jgi:hypothetical protein
MDKSMTTLDDRIEPDDLLVRVRKIGSNPDRGEQMLGALLEVPIWGQGMLFDDVMHALTYAALEVAEKLSEAEIKRLKEQLRPGSPTERAPTQWAYDKACKVLRKTKAENKRLAIQYEDCREEAAALRALLGEQGDVSKRLREALGLLISAAVGMPVSHDNLCQSTLDCAVDEARKALGGGDG